MRIANIYQNDVSNSITGFTMAIYTQGCNNYCKDCWNKNTWSFSGGEYIAKEDLFNMVVQNRHRNVSLLGGDPFFHKNKEEVIWFINEVLSKTEKTLYVWTGYSAEEVISWIGEELFNKIHFIICDKFDIEKRDLNLVLRGSSNQRIFCKGIHTEL